MALAGLGFKRHVDGQTLVALLLALFIKQLHAHSKATLLHTIVLHKAALLLFRICTRLCVFTVVAEPGLLQARVSFDPRHFCFVDQLIAVHHTPTS